MTKPLKNQRLCFVCKGLSQKKTIVSLQWLEWFDCFFNQYYFVVRQFIFSVKLLVDKSNLLSPVNV